MLDRPVCIIGAARSGTTVLGQLLSRHPTVAYWEEPKYLWRYRKPTASHDVRSAEEATARVRDYIRSSLARYVEQNDGNRLVEKTPSNCFRVPFVYAVLPDVRIVHLVRDGRDVALSARRQWRRLHEGQNEVSEKEGHRTVNGYDRIVRPIWNRLRSLEVPLLDLPFYALEYVKRMVAKGLGREGHAYIWGPKFPGIRDVVRTQDVLDACAIQWAKSVQAARKGLRKIPADQQLQVRFEDLIHAPSPTLRRILDFTGLPEAPGLLDHAEETLWSDAAHRWRKRDEEEIRQIMEQVGGVIQQMERTRE